MRPLPAELDTPAALHGASAFTTVRVQGGAALLWPEHLARLRQTCTFLGLPAPEGELPDLPSGPHLLRVTVTEGGTFWNARALRAEPRPESGVGVVLSDIQIHPQLGQHKTGNYLPYRLAAAQAQAAGAFEAWLTDPEGHVVDGSRTSPVLKIGGELVRPAGGLPSVTRALWLRDLLHVTRPVHVSELGQVTRAWICGAGVGVVPVSVLDGRSLAAEWPEAAHPALNWPTTM